MALHERFALRHLAAGPPLLSTSCLITLLHSSGIVDILVRQVSNGSSPLDINFDIFEQLSLPSNEVSMLNGMAEDIARWFGKHAALLPRFPLSQFVDRLLWLDCGLIDDANTADGLIAYWMDSHGSDAECNCSESDCDQSELAFRWCAVYCQLERARLAWSHLSDELKSKYLTDTGLDPITMYWTSVCSGQTMLANSPLIPALYLAAELNYKEAFQYFWRTISRLEPDSINFRGLRAFQLAALRGHSAIMKFLWEQTSDDQHKAMSEALLQNLSGTATAFQRAASCGFHGIIKSLFSVARFDQISMLLRANDCRAFNLACDHSHTGIVQYFLDKAKRYGMVDVLVASRSSRALLSSIRGSREVLKILWNACSRSDKIAVLNSIQTNDAIFSYLSFEKSSHLDLVWESLTCDDFDLKLLFYQKLMLPSLLHWIGSLLLNDSCTDAALTITLTERLSNVDHSSINFESTLVDFFEEMKKSALSMYQNLLKLE